MKYCSACGEKVSHRIPDGDHLPRYICDHCKSIHYQNPRVITGCVATWQDKILMCKRAIEPRLGYWTLPAGFLEIGETAAEGAARETLEEARARVEVISLFSFINVTYIGQIYTFYRAEMVAPEHGPAPESSEVLLMDEKDIPWDELAFPTVKLTLQDFFADRRAGRYELHHHDLKTPPYRRGG